VVLPGKNPAFLREVDEGNQFLYRTPRVNGLLCPFNALLEITIKTCGHKCSRSIEEDHVPFGSPLAGQDVQNDPGVFFNAPAPAFEGTGSGGSPARLEFSGFPTKPFGNDSSNYTGTVKRPVMHPEKSKAVGIKPHDLLQNVRMNKKTVGPLEAGPRFR